MKFLLLAVYILVPAYARADTIEGKLIQIIESKNSMCGPEVITVVITGKTIRFIYSFGEGKAEYYQHFVGKKVKIGFNESNGCASGIIKIKEVL